MLLPATRFAVLKDLQSAMWLAWDPDTPLGWSDYGWMRTTFRARAYRFDMGNPEIRELVEDLRSRLFPFMRAECLP